VSLPVPTSISSQPSVRGAVLGGLGATLLLAGLWRVDGVMAALGLGLGTLIALAWLLGRLNLTNLAVTFEAPPSVPHGGVVPRIVRVSHPRGAWGALPDTGGA